jgi:hypothetical protein
VHRSSLLLKQATCRLSGYMRSTAPDAPQLAHRPLTLQRQRQHTSNIFIQITEMSHSKSTPPKNFFFPSFLFSFPLSFLPPSDSPPLFPSLLFLLFFSLYIYIYRLSQYRLSLYIEALSLYLGSLWERLLLKHSGNLKPSGMAQGERSRRIQ